MRNIINRLDTEGGVLLASSLSKYEHRLMRVGALRGTASYYTNRHGVLVVIDMREVVAP